MNSNNSVAHSVAFLSRQVGTHCHDLPAVLRKLWGNHVRIGNMLSRHYEYEVKRAAELQRNLETVTERAYQGICM